MCVLFCLQGLSYVDVYIQGLLYLSTRWFDTRAKHIKQIMDGLTREVDDNREPFAAGMVVQKLHTYEQHHTICTGKGTYDTSRRRKDGHV